MGTATGTPSDEPSRAFRDRARLEAERYGPDPWIFVRELLQNARDAGADQVKFSVFDNDGRDGHATVICWDNGEGMTFEHARRYLFALYASSKEGKKNQAGQFGVGFWSILRFEPVSIVIRSRPRKGLAWGIELDGTLENVLPTEPPANPGTEIILRRPPGHPGLEGRITDAVWQSARYLTQRDHPEASVEIQVNGRPLNADFALAAPSAAFRRRNLRGVVGLGPAPRVELFSRGLRVRSAACLEDLLAPTGRHSSWLRVEFTELPGGLAPAALLESADLEIMLSRSDARDNRALGRLVKLAQQELERLIERQLEVACPLPWWSRVRSWLAERLRGLSTLRPVDIIALAMVGVVLIAVAWRGGGTSATGPGPPGRAVLSIQPQEPTTPSTPAARPFDDLRRRYRGPEVDGLASRRASPTALRYRPPEGQVFFAALTFARLAPDGSPVPEEVAEGRASYATTTCEPGNCLDVEVQIDSSDPELRIPVPTGHRLVTGSLAMDGARPRLRATGEGQPVVILGGPTRGLLRYQTAATAEPSRPRVPRAPASLPARLLRRADQLRTLPIAIRVGVLRDLVAARVAYDSSEPTARRHRQLGARGDGFIRRTLAIGAGDCDVQNSLLTALLHAADVPARLAVGYQGVAGGVLGWLHAWVEYQDDDGRWLVADASAARTDSTQIVAAAPGTSGRSARPGAAPVELPTELEPTEDSVAVGRARSESAEPVQLESSSLAAEPGTVTAASGDPAGPSFRTARSPAQAPSLSASPFDSVPGWVRSWPFRLFVPLILVLAGWSRFGRMRRAFKLDPGADLSKLLKGVLQQPEAFGHIGALLYRPLVPLANGNAISLMKARELASRGQLFCTHHRPALAFGALRAGAVVLDHRREEGRVVADALGAVDLDAWSTMLDGMANEPLLDGVNRLLRQRGESWAVKASVGVEEGVAAVDLAHLGAKIPEVHGTRLILVDVQALWLAEARRYYQSRPQAAIFMVLDHLALRLGLAEPRRGQLLGECAREAILESFAVAR